VIRENEVFYPAIVARIEKATVAAVDTGSNSLKLALIATRTTPGEIIEVIGSTSSTNR